MRILIADDSLTSRIALRMAIEQLGHEYEMANDGSQAWTLCQASTFDVIISDWVMPGMDGSELCQRVRAAEGGSYTYFILLTSIDDSSHYLAGMESGADDYVIKPPDYDQLRARLIAAERVTALHRRLAEQKVELERLNKMALESARIDALTLIGNRLRMQEDLASLHARAIRYQQGFSVAMCDVDLFKLYNDTYGHLGGDDVLRRVAGAIQGQVRFEDAAYRYGGEEFLMVLPQQSLVSGAVAAERVRKAVEALGIEHAGKTPPGLVTISIGVGEFNPEGTDSIDALISHADEALYEAKESGRNCVKMYDPMAESAGSI